MIQVYYGDGKGKTTAAVGAAVRALGAGWRVRFVQFLKNGDSSEVAVLRRAGADYRCASEPYALFSSPEGDARERLAAAYAALLAQTAEQAADFDLIVLDEALDAVDMGLLDDDALAALLKKEACEWVLTGHTLLPAMADAADYVTRMVAERHPYAHGAPARRGVEF